MNYKGPERRKGATTSVRFTRDDEAFLDSMGKRSRNAAISECLRMVKEAVGWVGIALEDCMNANDKHEGHE